MDMDQPPGQRKPHAPPAAFCRKIRLKGQFQCFRREAHPGVGHTDHDVVAFPGRFHRELFGERKILPLSVIGSKGRFMGHGVQGIGGHRVKNGVQEVGIGHDQGKGSVQAAGDGDAIPFRVASEPVQKFAEKQIDIKRARVEGGSLGEQNQVFNDLGDVVRAPFSQRQHFTGGSGKHLLKAHLNPAVKGAEPASQFMSHSAAHVFQIASGVLPQGQGEGCGLQDGGRDVSSNGSMAQHGRRRFSFRMWGHGAVLQRNAGRANVQQR